MQWGTPHVESYSSGLACWMPRLVSYNVSTGDYMMPDCSEMHEDRYDHPDFKIPEVMFRLGLQCCRLELGRLLRRLDLQCVRRGTKMVVIDPVASLGWQLAPISGSTAPSLLLTLLSPSLCSRRSSMRICTITTSSINGHTVSKLLSSAALNMTSTSSVLRHMGTRRQGSRGR